MFGEHLYPYMDAELRLPEVVRWDGWETTWTKLRAAGWEITKKAGYENWRYSDIKSNDKIYIRNKRTNYVGRLTLNGKQNEPLDSTSFTDVFCTLDFLTHEKNIRFKAGKFYEQEDLGEDDIPRLLELVLKLQKKFKREPKKQASNVVAMPLLRIA